MVRDVIFRYCFIATLNTDHKLDTESVASWQKGCERADSFCGKNKGLDANIFSASGIQS